MKHILPEQVIRS